MIKIEIINGFYKFYPEYTKELNNNFMLYMPDNFVKQFDYYTFFNLTKLNYFYLKGEKILNQIEAEKNILVDKYHPEQILVELNLCYDPYAQQLRNIKESYSNLDKENTSNFLTTLPIVGYNIKQAVCYFDTQKQRIIF